MNNVGILGPRHTFHDIATHTFLTHLTPVYFQNFEAIFKAVDEQTIDSALVGISNSLAGSVGDNKKRIAKEYNLLKTYDLRIKLCLGVIKAIDLSEIKAVYSHAMAIQEAKLFFQKNPNITPHIAASTSESIKQVKEDNTGSSAVIASREALEASGLFCLVEGLEDHPDNFTTFAHFVAINSDQLTH